MKITTKLSVLFGLALLISSQAQAALIQFTLDGEVTNAALDNPFNLTVGANITASGVFESSTITAGSTAGITLIDFSSSINNMEINVGNTTYTDADDIGDGGVIFFNNGLIDGLTYFNDTFDSADTFGIFSNDFVGTGIAGNWIASSYSVTTVPLPAAAWLFISGLLSLSVFSRRKRIL